MGRILELLNGNNFSLQYTNSIPATSITVNGKNLYARLTEVIIPVIFDKPVVLLNVSTSVPVGKIWEYAGRCKQITPTALGDSLTEEKPLFLNKRNLIFFSEISTNYSISYLPPRWFTDVDITIYQYNGIDTTDIKNHLNRIESKIDDISSYG